MLLIQIYFRKGSLEHVHQMTYTVYVTRRPDMFVQVCWHTKTNRIVGLAMTHEQLAKLSDAYEKLLKDQ